MPIEPISLEGVQLVLGEIRALVTKNQIDKEKAYQAVELIYEAANKTSFILKQQEQKPTFELSDIWMKAAKSVRDINDPLYRKLLDISGYWANLDNWTDEKILASIITLNSIKNDASKIMELYRRKKSNLWLYIITGVIIIGIGGLFLKYLGYFESSTPNNRASSTFQLTVYVHGPRGKQDIVLENTGKLVVDFRNDRRTTKIGEDGRTNFGEIPMDFKDSLITIGLEAPSYVQLDPGYRYKLDGNAIYLAVKKDESQGKIVGIIKNRDGSKFISGAKIMIGNDTTVTSNLDGIFKIVLPEHLHKAEYHLTITKEGYANKTETYYPLSGDIEIRMDKK